MKRDTALFWASAALALSALAIAGYLSFQAVFDQPVAGCGGDAGCGAVLASPWSKVGPLPVSLLGCVTYLAVLVGLGLRWSTNAQSRLGDALLLAAAPAMLLAAGWFTYIQRFEIGEICPYCMAGHGLGVVLALIIGFMVLPKPALRPAAPVALGVFASAALIAAQHLAPANDTRSTDNYFADQDGDTTTPDGKRHVSMFGGDLQFVLQDTPHLGNDQAKQVVGLIFDYGCLHCRAMHKLLGDAIEQDDTRFAVVPLPITIQPSYNPYTYTENSAFDDSYERAKLSLAVADIDRAKWRQFDRWLWSADSTRTFPRSAKDARAKAVELVGEAALREQLTGDALRRHTATIQRNIELLGHIDPPRAIPTVTTPGAPRHLTERFYDVAELEQMLDEAARRLADSKQNNAETQ